MNDVSEQLKALETLHRADIELLKSCPDFKSAKRGRQWLEGLLAGLWRETLRIEDDDVPICDELEMTDTMVLILRLFCHAVHHKGRSKLPRISHWVPVLDGPTVRLPHAIAKRNIGAIIGKGQSAVDDAIGRFRGKQSRYERFFDKRLAYPAYVPTGIMLDVMFSLNLSFAFMYDDYMYAEGVADQARVSDAPTNHHQKIWCREARAATGNATSDPHEDVRVNVSVETVAEA